MYSFSLIKHLYSFFSSALNLDECTTIHVELIIYCHFLFVIISDTFCLCPSAPTITLIVWADYRHSLSWYLCRIQKFWIRKVLYIKICSFRSQKRRLASDKLIMKRNMFAIASDKLVKIGFRNPPEIKKNF